jgi:hypothetical protein
MNTLLKLTANYFVLIIIFVLLIFTTHSIPNKYISKNVKKSSLIIQEEGLYRKFFNFKLFQLDNYTDVLMLNLAASVDSKNPLQAGMINNYYNSGNFWDLAKDTEMVADDHISQLQTVSYGRYWQGYLVILRPILCILDYSQIRILNYLLLFSLVAASAFLIAKRISKIVMVAFLTSLLLINFPIVPLSMQFSTVFYIALTSIVIILYQRERINNEDRFLILFFTLGGCTSFLDFLTVPIITLGLPLTIYILSSEIAIKKSLVVIKGSLVWGLGYGLIWASKWIIGGAITGVDILGDAMEWEAVRTSNLYKGIEMTIPAISNFVWQTLIKSNLLWIFYLGIALALLALVIYFFLLKSKKAFIENIYLLLIVSMVPAWYMVLKNHSMEHGWMTWRAIVVAIFAGILFVRNTISINRIYLIFKRTTPEK